MTGMLNWRQLKSLIGKKRVDAAEADRMFAIQELPANTGDEAWFRRDEMASLLNGMGLRTRDGQRFRADSGETAAFLRQLTFIVAKTYDRRYPDTKIRQFVPINTSIPAGADSFVWRGYDRVGMAKIVEDYSTDFPLVDVVGGEQVQLIKSLGSAYQFSLQEGRAAQFSGVQIETKRAFAAREAIERAIDALGATGSTVAGLPGFVNNGNVSVVTGGVTAGFNGDWQNASTTAKQILADARFLTHYQAIQTSETFQPNAAILDTASYATFMETPYSDINPESVGAVFLRTNPYVKTVDSWWRLSTASADNLLRSIWYKKDPDILDYVIPLDFEQLPPQPMNMAFRVNCHARVGGVQIYRPLGVLYGDLT